MLWLPLLVTTCATALEKLPAAKNDVELVALVKALRRLGTDKNELAVRERVVKLLERNTGKKFDYVFGPAGYKPQPEAVRKWTAWVTEDRSSEAYRRLRKHLDDGRQAYVVCPLIEESETSVARAAEREADRLRNGELKGYRVGLMHGRLRPAERRELMTRFKAGDLDVLVATTVIEVGVDVPNATIMIVQEADRFGLAQLHQLRGRVGRGAEQSYCLLVSRSKDELTETATARLEALVATTDGFELAEVDLELRGAGELLGTRQSGLTDFRFARLMADRPLLELARREAVALSDYEGPLDDEIDRVFGEDSLVA
jgi:ATP-dependent DNA helicase RecG